MTSCDRNEVTRRPGPLTWGGTAADFEAFFETAHDLLFVVDMEGRVARVNRPLLRRLGYEEGALQGQTAPGLLFKEPHVTGPRFVADMLTCRCAEMTLLARSGAEIRAETWAAPGRWGDGPALHCVARELSDQSAAGLRDVLGDLAMRLAELTTREEAAREILTTAVEVTGLDTVWLSFVDGQGLVLAASEGLTESEVEVVRHLDGDHPLRRALDGRRPVYEPTRELKLDSLFPGAGPRAVGAIPVWHDASLLGGLVAVARDRNELGPAVRRGLESVGAQLGGALMRLQRGSQVAESESRLRLVLEGAGAAYWDWDVARGRVYFSQRWAAMLGHEPDEIEPHVRAWEKRTHSDDYPAATKALTDHLAGRTGRYESEHRLRTKSGSWKWFLARGRVVARDADGRPLRMCGTHSDVSERKRAEEGLLQSQRMETVGRLAGGVAHEFNNLLTAIIGNAQSFREPGASVAARLDVAEELIEAAKRGAQLTRQLLAFSQQQPMQPRVVALNDVVLGMDPMLRRVIGEDIELVTMPGEGVGHVKVDVGNLEQVIITLAIEARNAMPQGGRLMITTTNATMDDRGLQQRRSTHSNYAIIWVSDTRGTAKAEEARHVFEPFFKEPSVEGGGLGLAAVYGIVKQHGGDIVVDTSEERGRTYKVYLPCVAAARPRPELDVSVDLPGGTETVLVAEDEPVVRTMVIRALGLLGYRVLAAENGEEALAVSQAHDHRLDLLIADIVMPLMGGGTLVERLRAIKPELRVLYMSGYAESRIELLGERSQFLAKPFTMPKLARVVRELLDRK